jgi:hypothetical protein
MSNNNTGGIDTAHISLYVQWKGNEFFRAVEQWKEGQEIAKNGIADSDESDNFFTLQKYNFEIMPYGHNPGKTKFSHYPFVLLCNGIRFCFSEREYKPDKCYPNVRVEMGSLALMHLGFSECWEMVKEIISLLDGEIKRNTLGRIDVCVDLAGETVDKIQNAIWEGRFVTRAKDKARYASLSGSSGDFETLNITDHSFGRKNTGVEIGRSSIRARIYDKIHESADNEEKLLVLTHKRYGGNLPDKAIRVEFQLRTGALRNLNVVNKKSKIESVEDWLKCEADVCKYLCKSWLRVYKNKFDQTHTSRLGEDDLLDVWKKVVEAFESWAGKGDEENVKRETRPLKVEAFKLIQEGFGCLRSAFVRCGIHFNKDNPEWIRQFCALSNKAFKRNTVQLSITIDFAKGLHRRLA